MAHHSPVGSASGSHGLPIGPGAPPTRKAGPLPTPLPARAPTHRTTVSSAHLRFGWVWWLSIVRSALEPDSQVVQPRRGAGKEAHTRGPAPGHQPNPTQPPPPAPPPREGGGPGLAVPPLPRPADHGRDPTGAHPPETEREMRYPHPPSEQAEQGTRARIAAGHESLGTALLAPCQVTSRSARVKRQGEGGRGEHNGSASAQTHHGQAARTHVQPDWARGTHRPHGMVFRQARTRDTQTEQPAHTPQGARGWTTRKVEEARSGTGPAPLTCRLRCANTSRVL